MRERDKERESETDLLSVPGRRDNRAKLIEADHAVGVIVHNRHHSGHIAVLGLGCQRLEHLRERETETDRETEREGGREGETERQRTLLVCC